MSSTDSIQSEAERSQPSKSDKLPKLSKLAKSISVSGPGFGGVLSRLDWPILLFIAWICSRTFWFCEPLGQSCDYLWGILALFGSAVGLLLGKSLGVQDSGLQPSSETQGKQDNYTWFQFSWLDGLAGAFFLIYIITDIAAIGTGNQRATLNALWSGVFWSVAYGLTRLIVNSACRRRILVSALVLISVVLSVWGLYQYYYEYPLERERYLANPEKTLYESGIWYEKGSANRKLFEDRFFAMEPTASFALSNTLGAFLVPGFILLAAGVYVAVSKNGTTDKSVTKQNWGYSTSARNGRESAWTRVRWFAWLRAGFAPTLCCLIILITIARTGSRSSALAIAFVAAAAALIWIWKRFANKKKALASLVGIAIFGTIGAGIVLMRAPRILDAALLSVEYRLQYWDATLDMIADHPLLGIGAGNFQERYTGYMSAYSGESISDPHNFLLEIAILAGIPGAILFWSFLGGVYWRVWQTSRNAVRTNEIRKDEIRKDEIALHAADSDEPFCPNVAGLTFLGVCIGLLSGFFMGLIAAGRNPGPVVVLLLSAALVSYCLRNLFRSLPTSPQAVAVAAAGLLIALLASGGIAYTTTAVLFWVLCALAVSPTAEAEPNPVSKTSGSSFDSLSSSGSPDPWIMLNVPLSKTLAILPLGLLAVCYYTGYYPTTEATARQRQAWYATNSNDRLSYLQQAVELDPLDCWTHSALASYCLQQWRDAVNRQEKTDGTAETFWNCFENESLLAIERNSRSSILWLEYGKGLWEKRQKTQSEEDLASASQAFQNSCHLFPVDLTSKAWLALVMASQAYTKTSFKTVQEYARDVLKASDETAHHNRKLPEELKKKLQKLVEIDIELESLREKQNSDSLKEENKPE